MTANDATWITELVAERTPDAVVCLDTFHVIGWATKALDEVRRLEWNKLRAARHAGAAKEFKGLVPAAPELGEPLDGPTRDDLGTRDREPPNLPGLPAERRAARIFALGLIQVRAALDSWLAYAFRSKLAPFVKLARTIRRYRASVEPTIGWRLTNGIAESNDVSVGRLRTNAREFHDPEAFITMIMLDRTGLAPDLPWPTR